VTLVELLADQLQLELERVQAALDSQQLGLIRVDDSLKTVCRMLRDRDAL
jgi:hypothetical protein